MNEWRLEIEPQPSPEESAAIVGVLRRLGLAEELADPPVVTDSGWRALARRERLHGGSPWEPQGWARAARLRQQ